MFIQYSYTHFSFEMDKQLTKKVKNDFCACLTMCFDHVSVCDVKSQSILIVSI